MGTLRVWFLSTLLVLQYAGVQALPTPGCAAASVQLKLACPNPPPADFHNCKAFPPTATSPLKCDPGLSLFVDKNGDGRWKKGYTNEEATCAAGGQWKVTGATPADSVVLSSASFIVCAKPVPCGVNCQEADVKKTALCDVTKGCIHEAASAPVTTAGCMTVTCPGAGFLIAPGKSVQEKTLKCHPDGKWYSGDGNSVADKLDEAVCVKHFECHKKTVLKTDCSHPEYDFGNSGCVTQFSGADDNQKNCPIGKNMFIFESNAWNPEPRNKITCAKDTDGSWLIVGSPSDSPLLGPHVICATSAPVKKSCTPLASSCVSPGEVRKDSGCTTITPKSDGSEDEARCPAGSTLYWKGTAWQAMERLKCDTSIGKWKYGATFQTELTITGGETVICATSDPVPKPCAQFAKSKCPLPITSGCTKFTPPLDGSAAVCPAGKDLWHESAAAQWVQHKAVTCDTTRGLWQEDTALSQLVDASTANLVCADSDPTPPKPCNTNQMLTPDGTTNEILNGGCEQVGQSQTQGDMKCSAGPPPKKLYILKDGASQWELADIKCDPKTGFWMREETSPQKYQVQPADQVICAETIPWRKGDCQDANNLQSACPAGTDTSVGCEAITSFITDAIDCPGKSIFYKPSGEGIWKGATSIECDPNQTPHKWMRDATVPMAAGDEVICADKNPTPYGAYCQGINELKSDCSPYNKGDCDFFTDFNSGNVTCASLTEKIYFKPAGPPAVEWTQTDKIECKNPETATPVWQYGSENAQPLPQGAIVACALSNPGVHCKESKPQGACPSDVPAGHSCDDAVFKQVGSHADDTVDDCTGTKRKFIKQGDAAWADAGSLKCDELGKWTLAEPKATPVKASDVVVCAEWNPSFAIPPNCPAPVTSKCDNVAAEHNCEPAVHLDQAPICLHGKKLYFKVEDNDKFMKAETITCKDGKWEVNYRMLHTESKVMATISNAVCADSNPDPQACKYGTNKIQRDLNVYNYKDLEAGTQPVTRSKEIPNGEFAEAGAVSICKDEHFKIGNTKDTTTKETVQVVCGQQGKWLYDDYDTPKPFGDGSEIGCVYPNCKLCKDVPNGITKDGTPSGQKGFHEIPVRNDDLKLNWPKRGITYSGTCATLECGGGGELVVETMENKFEYVSSKLTCNDNSKWAITKGGSLKQIKEDQALCVQMGVCLTGVEHVEVVAKCEDVPEFKDAGCEKAKTFAHPSNPEKMSCPSAGKKLMTQEKPNDYWEEYVNAVECSTDGNWKDPLDSKMKLFENVPEIRVICADSNPKPEPTTTTPMITTTTPMPICALCEKLPVFNTDGCETCLKTKDVKPEKSSNADECIIIIDKKEYILLVNNTVNTRLVCKRDGKWRTESGQEIGAGQVKAQKEAKKGEWQPASYGILAAAIIGIGGMAVGCVAIYMRMRKKISEREPKKKERGVTKKYTASNVMRTGGRSKGGSKESGKSREPTASKMEENIEDAPTLKL